MERNKYARQSQTPRNRGTESHSSIADIDLSSNVLLEMVYRRLDCRSIFNMNSTTAVFLFIQTKEGTMKLIVIALAVVFVLPCYCYPASLVEGMEDIIYLYDEGMDDFEIAQDAPCREWEALMIMGSVAIVYTCIILSDPDRCDLGLLSTLIAFYFYYIDCLPIEPAP